MTTELKSPLRYPGAKVVLADYFSDILVENLYAGCIFYETYAGGASMSLSLLDRGAIDQAVLIERDPLLYAFWKCVINQSEELCDAIQRVPITIGTWNSFQKYMIADALRRFDTLELGLACLFFNRTNFSGILAAKPIGGMSQNSQYLIDCRFNKDRIIDQILAIANHHKQIRVCFGDAIKFMKRNADKIYQNSSFVYVDPPYYQQGKKLYRYFYKFEQHQQLAEFMNRQHFAWIVSIDNHPVIQNLYKNQTIIPISLNYVIKQNRRATELLISNIPLAPPVYQDKHGNIIDMNTDDRHEAI